MFCLSRNGRSSDLNASKDTVTLSAQWMEDYGPDSGTVYNDKYIFKRN